MNQRWSRRTGCPLSVMLGLMVAMSGLPPATHGVAAAPLTLPRVQGQNHLAPVALTLTAAPTRMIQFQLGTITASLNRPVTTGRITFTLLRPAPAFALYSCTPIRGRCAMAWSRRTPGSVTIAARWSGDHHYGPASASLTMTMRRSRYTYTGTWQGTPLGPLTRVVPPVVVTHLAHATLTSQLHNFRTNDPAYTCLNGRALDVFMAPQEFPDDYVAYTRGRGARCPSGTWLYPQQPGMPAMRLAITALDPVITLHGAFPLPHPYTGVVQFFIGNTLVAGRPIISWSAHTVTVRVPPRLAVGTYSVRVGWYDRLTGSTAHSRVPSSVQLNATIIPGPEPITFRFNSSTRPTVVTKLPRLAGASLFARPDQDALAPGKGFVPDAWRVLHIIMLQISLEKYRSVKGSYPPSLASLFPDFAPPATGRVLTAPPVDPQTHQSYTYTVTPDGSDYLLSATLSSGRQYTGVKLLTLPSQPASGLLPHGAARLLGRAVARTSSGRRPHAHGITVKANNTLTSQAISGAVLDPSPDHAQVAVTNLHQFWTNLALRPPVNSVHLTPANPLAGAENIGGIYARLGVLAPAADAVWDGRFDTRYLDSQAVRATPTVRGSGSLQAGMLNILTGLLAILGETPSIGVPDKNIAATTRAVRQALDTAQRSPDLIHAVQALDRLKFSDAVYDMYWVLSEKKQRAVLRLVYEKLFKISVRDAVLTRAATVGSIIELGATVADEYLALALNTYAGQVTFYTSGTTSTRPPVATTAVPIAPTNTPTSRPTATNTPTAAWTATAAPPPPTNTLRPTTTATPTPTATRTSNHTIKTVFLIVMENHNWSSIQGNTSEAPYINSLLSGAGSSQTSYATQYFNPPGNHPSLPNYLWLEAGTNFGITDDNAPSSHPLATTSHLVSLLNTAGISWKAYEEGISDGACPMSDNSATHYAARHNPFVYFNDVTASSAYCTAHERSYSDLAGDLATNTVARYNFITPNLCDDMHDSCAPTNDAIKQGDMWLQSNLPAILSSQAYKNGGAVFITWDEGEGSDGPIGLIVLSPAAKGHGYHNAIPYTHSSTLRTLEEIYGVRPLLGDAAKAMDVSDLFSSFP